MKHSSFIYSLCLGLALMFPHTVLAAQLFLTASNDTFSVGDTIIVHAYLDTEGANLNVVEGAIKIPNLSQFGRIDIRDSQSVLKLWPQKPTFSINSGEISFVGGVPDGFISSRALLFDLIISIEQTGELSLSPQVVRAYVNDGKGTVVPVITKDVMIRSVPFVSESARIDESKIDRDEKQFDTSTGTPLKYAIALFLVFLIGIVVLYKRKK